MPEPFDVVFLQDCPDAIPIIEDWFMEEWPQWYGPDGPGDARADLNRWSQKDALPLACIALSANGEPMGIAALKPDGLGAEHGITPFLSAFYVAEPYRRKGVGTALTRAIEAAALTLNIPTIYGTTDGAKELLQQCGWIETGLTSQSERGTLPIFKSPPKEKT